jgi:hypothetical protein
MPWRLVTAGNGNGGISFTLSTAGNGYVLQQVLLEASCWQFLQSSGSLSFLKLWGATPGATACVQELYRHRSGCARPWFGTTMSLPGHCLLALISNYGKLHQVKHPSCFLERGVSANTVSFMAGWCIPGRGRRWLSVVLLALILELGCSTAAAHRRSLQQNTKQEGEIADNEDAKLKADKTKSGLKRRGGFKKNGDAKQFLDEPDVKQQRYGERRCGISHLLSTAACACISSVVT